MCVSPNPVYFATFYKCAWHQKITIKSCTRSYNEVYSTSKASQNTQSEHNGNTTPADEIMSSEAKPLVCVKTIIQIGGRAEIDYYYYYYYNN